MFGRGSCRDVHCRNITLSSNGLVGTIPSTISGFTSLQYVLPSFLCARLKTTLFGACVGCTGRNKREVDSRKRGRFPACLCI